jgi:hypothetical protein
MLPDLLLPLLAAGATGWLAWWHQTRRLDVRSFDEPRGWDMPEAEFRHQVMEERKRRRIGAMVLAALAGSALAGIIVQVTGLGHTGAL